MLKRWITFLLEPIRKNRMFYLSILALFFISIIFVQYGRCSRMRALLEVFGDVYLLCAMLLLIPRSARRRVKLVLFALFFAVGLVDMACYVIMGSALVPNIVQTWLQTNTQEASEALRVFVTPKLLLSPVALFLILPFLCKQSILKKRLALWGMRREVKRDGFPFGMLRGASGRKIRQYAGTALVVLTLISLGYGLINKVYLYKVFSQTSADDAKEFVEVESMTREYLPIYRLALSVKEISRFSHQRACLLNNVKHTTVKACRFESPIIVLIIGESYNRHHASLYGYGLPTTPIQQRLYDEGQLFRFDDVVTSYNLTFKSFQNMLTLYDYDARGHWYDYPVVPSLFRKAGYKVGFFSNQNTLDKKSAFTDYSEDVFMNNTELSKFMFDVRNTESHRYDMSLTNDYLSMMGVRGRDSAQLVIFHFIGIHADYRFRYPEGDGVFSAADYHRPDLTDEELGILSDYDNAIRYNDKVIGAIVDLFADKDAVIIHLADHGELVYDDGHEMGRNFTLQRKNIIPQFDIPFWIYCSDAYKAHHPTICRQIAGAVGRPFMTDDLPHLLLYLAGIECDGYQPERNLIDDRFNMKRKRLIMGDTDYDSIMDN